MEEIPTYYTFSFSNERRLFISLCGLPEDKPIGFDVSTKLFFPNEQGILTSWWSSVDVDQLWLPIYNAASGLIKECKMVHPDKITFSSEEDLVHTILVFAGLHEVVTNALNTGIKRLILSYQDDQKSSAKLQVMKSQVERAQKKLGKAVNRLMDDEPKTSPIESAALYYLAKSRQDLEKLQRLSRCHSTAASEVAPAEHSE